MGVKRKLTTLKQPLAKAPMKLSRAVALAGGLRSKPPVIPAFARMTGGFRFPFHHAEQRRHKGVFSKRLFECSEFPIAAFMLSTARKPLGRGVGVPISLVTFFSGSCKKVTSLRATPDTYFRHTEFQFWVTYRMK